jgi:hypothetical protein
MLDTEYLWLAALRRERHMIVKGFVVILAKWLSK